MEVWVKVILVGVRVRVNISTYWPETGPNDPVTLAIPDVVMLCDTK